MKRIVVTVAVGLGAMLVAAPVAAAYSRADRAIVRDFMRHHHGDKVLAVVHSDWVPEVGVWYVRGGGAGGYAVGGAAFYRHGRHVRPRGDDAFFAGPRPVYALSFTGSGTYSKTESSASGDGGTVTESRSAQFQWSGNWGGSRRTVVTLHEDPYNPDQFSVSGTTSYSGTSNSSCTGSLNAKASADLALTAERRGMWNFSFDLVISPASSSDSNCGFAPQDPSADVPEVDPITLAARYHAEAVVGHGADNWNVIYAPFTLPVALHHHVHTSPSADNPDYSADADLSVGGTARFTLIGLASG